jgi:lambda family phage portal protein
MPCGRALAASWTRYVRDGIEFNRRGARVAYWMHTEHPQDDGRAAGFNNLVRIPARDVIHHYLQTRPGQRRGEPVAVRSLLGAHTFDSYEDAELVRKQTRAPFTGAVYREAFADQDWRFDPFTGAPISGASDPEVDVAAGTFLALAPDEQVKLFDADDNGAGLAEYSRQVLLKIAAGLGVPYEVMSGDWKQVNDRLVRAILNEFRRGIEAAQDHFIHRVCRGVWAWWMDAAVADGSLSAPDYAARWADYQTLQARPHGWRHFNPVQDVEAKIKALEARLTSRQAVIDEQPGPSVEEIDAQIAEDAARNTTPPAAAAQNG